MSDMPKEIWAIDGADQAVKEIWQPDNVWGDYAVKYIRADLVPQWRPIETAPKDGSTIMLMRWSEMMPEIYSAWWMPIEKSQGYDGVEYDGYYWVLNDDSEIMVEDDNDLSIWYWQPLQPPTEDA